MRFKPIFTDEELKKAEEEIAEAARNFSQTEACTVQNGDLGEGDMPSQNPVSDTPLVVSKEKTDFALHLTVAPEPNITLLTTPFRTKLAAVFGIKTERWRKIDAVNRFVRTIRFGLEKGLYNPSKREGGREYLMCMKLYAEVKSPKTSYSDVLLALGWAQAMIAVACEGVSPGAVRAVK